LHWTTQTEINSDYFTVQHSTDGIHYSDLSRHTAAGQSVEKKEYSYTDNQVTDGIHYYRIRLTDKDGSQTYSPIRSVNFRNTAEEAVRLYPSPASEYLYIDIQDAALHNSICTIYNLQGQVMMQFKVTRGTEKKNISSLLPGYYVLRFANGYSSKIEKK
ncbi:MAG: T9SS type A sorting domain-containing protein, partial [Chitinophagaceae bacterium]|nr:T9SS type A sorting domain-containing protein [Chitinophagaceae bacterium]